MASITIVNDRASKKTAFANAPKISARWYPYEKPGFLSVFLASYMI